MEEEKVPSKPADARIVRAVRKLKSNISHNNNKLEENKTKENKNNPKTISRQVTRKGTQVLSGKNLIPLDNIANSNKQKINKINSTNKIQLDGSIKTNMQEKEYLITRH